MSIPGSLQKPLRDALAVADDITPIRSLQPVSGGCINHALRLQTEQSSYLLKWNADAPAGMFSCEASGLARLAAVGAVRVPTVLAVSDPAPRTQDQPGRPAFILLEWLEGSGDSDPGPLGEQLATLHRLGSSPEQPPAYGLDHDNFIGSSLQQNAWVQDWIEYFANYRLRPQMELARANGRLTPRRQGQLERLLEKLPALLGSVTRQPSLIHGDLWAGNVIPGPGGFAVIDPAVSYSDREAEIAFTELFGGFSARFYRAYQDAWPLEPGYPERRDLYNLYHLLNHLNLFGEGYGPQVDEILRRYSG